MGKDLSTRESRQRVKRAVLKTISKIVVNEENVALIGPVIPLVLPSEHDFIPVRDLEESENEVDNSQLEEYDNNCFDDSMKLNLSDDLKDWAMVYNITQRALSANLKIFRSVGHYDIPADARTLLKTPRKSNVVKCEDGTYYYAGIIKNLEVIVSKLNFEIGDMYIDFNIDGLPLSRSSRSDLWPILGRVYNKKFKSIGKLMRTQ